MSAEPSFCAALPLPLRRRTSHRHKRKLTSQLTTAHLYLSHFIPPYLLKSRRRYLLTLFLILLISINTFVLFINATLLHKWSFGFGGADRPHENGGRGGGAGRYGMVEIGEGKWERVYQEARRFADKVTGEDGDERKNGTSHNWGVAWARQVLKVRWEVPEVVVEGLEQDMLKELVFRLGYMETLIVENESKEDTEAEEGPVEGKTGMEGKGLIEGALREGDDIKEKRGKARCVFVHVQNGLGNRLRAMGSGIALAKKTARVPVVIWERDAHLSARFGDLFIANPMPTSRNPEVVLYRNLLIVEEGFPTWKDIASHTVSWRPYNYMLKDGDDAHIHFPLNVLGRETEAEDNTAGAQGGTESGVVALEDPVPPSAHVYLKTAYVIQTMPTIVVRRNVNAELRRLTPVHNVIKLFNTHPVGLLQKAIGVHIRSRGLERDNVGVDMSCEYTASGARMTEYWRRRSSKDVFAKQLRRYVKQNQQVSFFVAADDVAVIDDLRLRFPGRVLSIPRNCDDRSPECVQYALADLMSLARTKKLVGSHWSSFTETASRLGGRKRVLLSGRDFGRRTRGIKDVLGSAWASIQDQYRLFSHCRKRAVPAAADERR